MTTYFNYAQALHHLGRHFDALRYINKAISISPMDKDATALEASIQQALVDEAWADMELDTEDRLTSMCQHQMVADL